MPFLPGLALRLSACLAAPRRPAAATGRAARPRACAVRARHGMGDGGTGRRRRCLPASLRLDPALARNHLSLGGRLPRRGRTSRRPSPPARVRGRPARPPGRRAPHYAELLLRLRAAAREARDQFERFVADVQDDAALADEHLVHCHSRLMEIAEGEEDEYAEHLHRGIGLYLLARQRAALAEPGGESARRGPFCARRPGSWHWRASAAGRGPAVLVSARGLVASAPSPSRRHAGSGRRRRPPPSPT